MGLKQFIGTKLARWGTQMAIAGPYEGHERSRRYEDLPRERGSQDDIAEQRNDREEIMIAARAMCQLFGLGNRILRTYANYVVGECEVFWHTENENWNDQAAELWQAKAKLLDVRGREDFSGLARLALISMKRDGDCGGVKVLERPGFPMIDPIEADRIGPRNLTAGRTDLIGGVRLNAYQRPVEYHIADRARYLGGYQNLRPVPAASFLHVYDTMRFDAVRGMSAFAYGALGRSRALRQLIRSEQTGVEVANKWALLIQQEGPSLANGLNLSDNAEDATSDGKAGPPIEDLHDGMIFHGTKGENVQAIQNNRPSPTWTGFINFLIHDYAISLDLPFEFVWSMAGLGGPGVRLVSKQAERTFRYEWRNLNRRFFVPTISWVIAEAMDNGELPFNAEFWNFTVQRPDHPTIDVGRDTAANVSEYEKGWVSGADIAAESGRNIYRAMRQKGRELAYAAEIEAEFKLKPGSIIETGTKAPTTPNRTDKADQSDQTDDEKPNMPKGGTPNENDDEDGN